MQVSSFHAKATEVVAQIDHHQRVTEWLQDAFVPPPVVMLLPGVDAFRMHAIHHRERLREYLQNTILALAVVVNVVITVSHHQQGHGSPYGTTAQCAISALGLAIMALTIMNCGIWLCLHFLTFEQHGLNLWLSPAPPPPPPG